MKKFLEKFATSDSNLFRNVPLNKIIYRSYIGVARGSPANVPSPRN